MRRRAIWAFLLAATLAGGTVAAQNVDEARYREAAQLLGSALADLEAGNLGRAQAGFERLSRLLPENALPWINLAIVYLGLDRTDDALAALDRARAIDPDNAQLLFTEARALETRAASDRDALARWEETLRRLAGLDRDDPRSPWLRGRFLRDQRRFAEAAAAFDQAHRRSRDNLVVLVDRLVAAASIPDGEAAGDALDALEDRLNGFDAALEPYADRLRDATAAARDDALRPAALVLENLLRPTDLYQIGRAELEGRQAGAMLFPQLEFVPPLPKSIQGGADVEITWREETARSGLAAALDGQPVLDLEIRRDLAPQAVTADAAVVLLEAGPATLALRAGEPPVRRDGWPAARGAAKAWSHDFDQDARSDLLVALGDELVLHAGTATGELGAARPVAVDLEGGAVVVEPIDFDHDGDLDLLVGTPRATLLLQNRGGGGFVDVTAELAPPLAGGLTGAGAADFDEDGDLDLLLVYPAAPPRLLLNRRGGAFEDGSERAGLTGAAPAGGIAVADFDRDGRFDVLLWGGTAAARLLRNDGGALAISPLAAAEHAGGIGTAVVADLDNDGDPDVAAARGREVSLWRNRDGVLAREPAAALAAAAVELLALDLDGDGDLDLLARTTDRRVALLRNDGGNRNHWLRVALRGLVENNAKNNSEGLHALVEVRTGGSYQATLGNGGVNHLGLGARRQADVLRVVWTNGLAQTWQQLAAGQTLVEKQVLKGSCPFLYTWDGDDFGFLTDLMWRSTLGMTFADGSAAPHQSSRDWVLVPGAALRPAGGELWLQVTAELWETIYVDRQSLWAIDRPTALAAVVDESFRPPPHPLEPPLYLVERWLAPVAARDHAGRDVLAAIASRDGVHVDELPLTRYQGATQGHSLRLEFDHRPRPGDEALLVLWGWIFPTDTSINVALAQDPALDVAPPRLEVLLQGGSWQVLLPSIGLPMGKRKAMVIELGDALDAAELHAELATPVQLRVAGTMQIYWDAAALGFAAPPPRDDEGGAPATPARLTRLEPAAADLHYRGFSRLRRESASGPHLFDYRHTDVASPFPAMAGRYTKYGDVVELLRAADDRYAVMAPGDELTLRYDASALPPLAAGFARDYVLYTDGWVKDADLNTRESATVEPWPRHAMRRYPEAAGPPEAEDPAVRRWLDTYQTRWLDGEPFRDALRGGTTLPAAPRPRTRP